MVRFKILPRSYSEIVKILWKGKSGVAGATLPHVARVRAEKRNHGLFYFD
jgi:hypothetical protein